MNQGATTCRYHKSQPARWHCESCNLGLCGQCKPFAERVPDDVCCPLCSEPMRDLEIGELFWRQPHRHLSYPWETKALIVIGVIALAGVLMPGSTGVLLLSVPAFAVASWYAFHMFLLSSRGEPEPPGLDRLKSAEDFTMFQQFLTVSSIYAAAYLIAALAAPVLIAIVVALAVAVGYPASIMAMAVDDRVQPAFNPERMIKLAARVGMPYLVVSGLVLVLLTGPFLLLLPLGGILPERLFHGLLIFLQGYGYFLIARYVGYTLYQYQRQLEYSGGIPVIDREPRLKPEEYEPAIALTDAMIQTGEDMLTEARWTVGQALTRYPNHPGLNEQFEQLLISTEDDTELRNHLNRRLHKLTQDRNDDAAADTWRRTRTMLEDWLPRSSEARHRIGMALARQGHHREALKLLLSLPRDHPDYALLPEACMRTAQILEDDMGDTAGAEELRNFVRQRYPGRAENWIRHGDPE